MLLNRLVRFEIFYLLLDLCGLSHQQVWNLRNKVLLAVVFIVFQGLFKGSECPVRDIRWDLELEVSYVQQVVMGMKVADLNFDFVYAHVPEE